MTDLSPLFALEAEQLLLENKNDEAIELCNRGLEEFPEYPAAYAVLAQSFLEKNDIDSSKKAIEKGLGLFPEDTKLNRIMTAIKSDGEKSTLYQKPEKRDLSRIDEEVFKIEDEDIDLEDHNAYEKPDFSKFLDNESDEIPEENVEEAEQSEDDETEEQLSVDAEPEEQISDDDIDDMFENQDEVEQSEDDEPEEQISDDDIDDMFENQDDVEQSEDDEPEEQLSDDDIDDMFENQDDVEQTEDDEPEEQISDDDIDDMFENQDDVEQSGDAEPEEQLSVDDIDDMFENQDDVEQSEDDEPEEQISDDDKPEEQISDDAETEEQYNLKENISDIESNELSEPDNEQDKNEPSFEIEDIPKEPKNTSKENKKLSANDLNIIPGLQTNPIHIKQESFVNQIDVDQLPEMPPFYLKFENKNKTENEMLSKIANKINELAQSSSKSSEDEISDSGESIVASETMAKIYKQQGVYTKAIQVYKILASKEDDQNKQQEYLNKIKEIETLAN